MSADDHDAIGDTDDLLEAVVVACWEFTRGSLAENPRRVGVHPVVG